MTQPTSCGHCPDVSAASRQRTNCRSTRADSRVSARGWILSHPSPVPTGYVMQAWQNICTVSSGIWLATTAGHSGSTRGRLTAHWAPHMPIVARLLPPGIPLVTPASSVPPPSPARPALVVPCRLVTVHVVPTCSGSIRWLLWPFDVACRGLWLVPLTAKLCGAGSSSWMRRSPPVPDFDRPSPQAWPPRLEL